MTFHVFVQKLCENRRFGVFFSIFYFLERANQKVLNILLKIPLLVFIIANNTHVCSGNDLLVDFSRDTCGQVELSWGENQSEIS